MPIREIHRPKLNLSRLPGEQPFDVDMEAFFDFSFWMAEELLDLIAVHENPQPKRMLPAGVVPPGRAGI